MVVFKTKRNEGRLLYSLYCSCKNCDDIIMTILELFKIINSFMKAFLFMFFFLIVVLRFIEIDRYIQAFRLHKL